MSRTLVMGDVHGAYKAMEQVLERASYDPVGDRLIFLGDAVDGWPETDKVLEFLSTVPEDLVFLLGNHDEWFQWWYQDKWQNAWEMLTWTEQGGRATKLAYHNLVENVPQHHRDLLDGARLWHVDQGRVFVHGGWDFRMYDHPKQAPADDLNWNRDLWETARRRHLHSNLYNSPKPEPVTRWKEVYVGHTSTARYSAEPVQACEVWNMDQGAGWYGNLSAMDVDTKEHWQSDLVGTLYPDRMGR